MDIGAGFLEGLDRARTNSLFMRVAERPSLLDQAIQQYPLLGNSGLQFRRGETDDGRLLEFWPPGEPGSSQYPRPSEFDIAKPGVEVFSDKVRPIDVLGDVVSHYLVENDPKLKSVYSAFSDSITPKQEQMLRKQYQFARENDGEDRPYEKWRERSGLPAFFRGHPFEQWPAEFNQANYTPEQIQLLDRMMNYLKAQ